MKKKYVCCAGYVKSRNDGERHLINASNLPRLYNINPKECFFCYINDDIRSVLRGYSEEERKSFIYLSPRSDGNYAI